MSSVLIIVFSVFQYGTDTIHDDLVVQRCLAYNAAIWIGRYKTCQAVVGDSVECIVHACQSRIGIAIIVIFCIVG